MLVIVVVSGIRQNNQAKEQTSQDLASLENKDAGYIVKYPTNFDVIYTQNGVEFTPKQSQVKSLWISLTALQKLISRQREQINLNYQC